MAMDGHERGFVTGEAKRPAASQTSRVVAGRCAAGPPFFCCSAAGSALADRAGWRHDGYPLRLREQAGWLDCRG